jgi:tRNA(fMet)-specific endonuclease VapC
MEQIVYDTNGLIDAAKKRKLGLSGFTTILNLVEFPKALEFEDLTVLYPNIDDYQESLEISIDLLQKGTPLPAVDILVAAMCIKRNYVFNTKDNHFTAIKTVRKNFKLELTT